MSFKEKQLIEDGPLIKDIKFEKRDMKYVYTVLPWFDLAFHTKILPWAFWATWSLVRPETKNGNAHGLAQPDPDHLFLQAGSAPAPATPALPWVGGPSPRLRPFGLVPPPPSISTTAGELWANSEISRTSSRLNYAGKNKGTSLVPNCCVIRCCDASKMIRWCVESISLWDTHSSGMLFPHYQFDCFFGGISAWLFSYLLCITIWADEGLLFKMLWLMARCIFICENG